MNEHGPIVRLEQRCVRPGEWVIEGWRVQRIQDIASPINHWWDAEMLGEHFQRHSLAEVRDEIRDRIAREERC